MRNANNLYLYIFLLFLASLINYILQNYIINENLIVEYFQEQMSHQRILSMIETRKELIWVKYLFLPIIYLVKFSLVSFWILCGTIIAGYKIIFKSIFRVVLLAEFVWLLPSFILIVWFGFFETSYTFNEVQYFAPLSLLSVFDATQLDPWLIYPLKSLNLFEFIYILVLAWGIKRLMKKDYDSALKFTLPVYGSALVVWILFVTFLSINLGA